MDYGLFLRILIKPHLMFSPSCCLYWRGQVQYHLSMGRYLSFNFAFKLFLDIFKDCMALVLAWTGQNFVYCYFS